MYGVRHNKEIVELLLSNGANVNAEDKSGMTPLFYFLWLNNTGDADFILTLLLVNGADVNAKSKGGGFAWRKVFRTQKINQIKTLIAFGADVKSKGARGTQPLHNQLGVEQIALLVNAGADINAKDDDGRTPLMYNKSNYESVKFLLKLGADIKKRDNNGLTIVDLALQTDHIESRVIELLKEYGGKSSDEILSEEIEALRAKISQLTENRKEEISKLERRITEITSKDSNPTDEWPRKMWEIDFGGKVDSVTIVQGEKKAIVASVSYGTYWIRGSGEYQKVNLGSPNHMVFLNDTDLVFQQIVGEGEARKIVTTRYFWDDSNDTISETVFERKKMTKTSTDAYAALQPVFKSVQVSWEGNKITGWDITPPSNNPNQNDGGNDNQSKLSLIPLGSDIAIATDGKLGGFAELQQSTDLKSWRKVTNLPADPSETVITPGDKGRGFFRIKRID